MISPELTRLEDVKERTLQTLDGARDQKEVTIPKNDLYTLLSCLQICHKWTKLNIIPKGE